MRKFCFFFLLSIWVWAVQTVNPVHQIVVNGFAKDMVLTPADTLLIATDNGHIEEYTISNYEKIKEISIPKVKDFMGDMMPARILSTDRMGDTYLLLSDSGKGGYSNLFVERQGKLTQILSPNDKEAIIKARFIDSSHILLGYLGDEVALLNIDSKKERYHVQLGESKFSDFALNEKKTEAVFACESGILSVIDVQTGKIIKQLKGQNLDNVYRVDFKNGMVSAAGKDRRGALYNVQTGEGSYIEGSFFIYATALSPSARKVAFAMDENNDISIYNTLTKSKLAVLKGQKSTLNVIVFKDENKLYSASDDNTVMVWDLGKQN